MEGPPFPLSHDCGRKNEDHEENNEISNYPLHLFLFVMFCWDNLAFTLWSQKQSLKRVYTWELMGWKSHSFLRSSHMKTFRQILWQDVNRNTNHLEMCVFFLKRVLVFQVRFRNLCLINRYTLFSYVYIYVILIYIYLCTYIILYIIYTINCLWSLCWVNIKWTWNSSGMAQQANSNGLNVGVHVAYMKLDRQKVQFIASKWVMVLLMEEILHQLIW